MISKIEIIDNESGTAVELSSDVKSVSWDTENPFAVNVVNSFQFQCDIDKDDEAAKWLFNNHPFRKAQNTAYRLTDELNDLIEEYHAPGNTRRERRAIQRQFNKLFSKLDKLCKTYHINYKYKTI